MDEDKLDADSLANCVADRLACEFGAQCGFNSARRPLASALIAAIGAQVAAAFAPATAHDGGAEIANFRRDGLGDCEE